MTAGDVLGGRVSWRPGCRCTGNAVPAAFRQPRVCHLRSQLAARCSEDRTPVFRVITRIDCDRVCVTPSSDSGTQRPLLVLVADK